MTKFYNFSRKRGIKVMALSLFLLTAFLTFQAQDTYDDSDHRFDRPTQEYRHNYTPPSIHPDVITDALGYDNFDIGVSNAEQWITANPQIPFNMIFGINTTNWYHSEDGFNWTYNNPTGSSSGDPIAVYDSIGNAYSQLLSGASNPVWRTTNNGITWGPGISSANGSDRNSMAADQTGGPFANYIYATAWSINASGQTSFARSTNNGASFTITVPYQSNTTPGNMIAVGPNGSIQGGRVVWVTITGTNPAPSTFNFFRSTNGGLTFDSTTSAISPGWVGTLNSAARLVINNGRTRPYPMIAMDNSYGPYRGRLYCVYASNVPAGNGNKPDIKCQYSNNGGATWSSEVIVNDNASPQLSDQWFPAVWCDRYTGKLYVKWYDTRNNPATYGTDVYASYSTDGGATFAPNQKLTTVNWVYPCPACAANTNCYRGDYDGIVGNRFSALAIWTDMRACSYANIGAYFPDFAMKVNPATLNVSNINDSAFSYISVPSVKLYSDKVKYTASISPTPGAGTVTLTFLNRSVYALQDSLTAYPDSVRLRVKATGGVSLGAYTITVTATGRIGGTNGPPIHKRTIALNVGPVGIISNTNEIPDRFYLYQNYPNPFNPTTQIKFDIAKAGNVKLSVFDVNGRELEVINNSNFNAGSYTMDFNAENLSTGIYFYKLETGSFTSIRKMIVLK